MRWACACSTYEGEGKRLRNLGEGGGAFVKRPPGGHKLRIENTIKSDHKKGRELD